MAVLASYLLAGDGPNKFHTPVALLVLCGIMVVVAIASRIRWRGK